MSSASTIVLITGANSGVGLAAAEVITQASEDFHVIIASRNAENGENAVEEVKSKGGIKGGLSTIQLDVNDQASIERAAKEVKTKFGRLDVLVNNAGIVSYSQNLKTNLEDTFRTNLTGPALVTEAFKTLLLKSKSPYSIYVSSGLGSITLAEDPSDFGYAIDAIAYRTSKAALNMLAVQEKRVLGKQGVKTFTMCPGLVVSNLRGKSEEARNAGNMAGDPRESGETMLGIIQGRRDADVGKFIHKDGVYGW